MVLPSKIASAAGFFARDESQKPLIATDHESVYKFGMLIRRTEELLLRLFSQGLLSGTTHTCLGQEICAMSVVRALNDPDDAVLSNHRNHGHFLTYSGNVLGLIAEIMGRRAGVCQGIGGSQHIADRGFHSNGVQGGMTAIGVGHALAQKKHKSNGITAVIIGDGTTGQGLLYESLNLASVWQVPLLFVIENNGIAQTTVTAETVSGTLEGRGQAFGIRTWRYDDSHPAFLEDVAAVVSEVRASGKPGFLVIDTMRLGPHSKGDDLRPAAEMELIRQRDPLARIGRELPPAQRAQIDADIDEFLHDVQQQALASPESTFETPKTHIFPALSGTPSRPSPGAEGVNVRAAINQALGTLLEDHTDVLLLGEDLHDPYGGAFKVTQSLSTRFPGRVISTPISEAGVVGAAIGLAMSGFRPIVEIMFADFLSLAMDQIYNHAVKFPGMFEDSRVPLVIRTPSGGRRGYGPTHSQCPENLVSGVPGLTVVYPSQRHDPALLLHRAVLDWNSPTIFFEHKLLYGRTVDPGQYREIPAHPNDPGADLFPSLVGGSTAPDLTLIAYGDGVHIAEAAAAQLAEEEVACEIVIPSLLSPLPSATLAGFLQHRDRILVIEEAPAAYGFAAELAAALLSSGFRGRFARVSPAPVPVPAARSLEAACLPNESDVMNRVIEMILADLTPRS